MQGTADPSRHEAWPLWHASVRRSEIHSAIVDLFRGLDAQVAARGPTCWTSGKCCNFDAYGHRLYVTGLEIAWVIAQLPAEQLPNPQAIDLKGPCVFQTDKLCTVHAIRPMGCRVFFCQRGTQEWQQELYESFLGKLRGLHDRFGLPYAYMEWRVGLKDGLGSVPCDPV
ncbi:MAG: hypothetical protein GC164_03095 [Phycisphaera sp.]|nr:hypothetical protein [Phycisphaera sp.]